MLSALLQAAHLPILQECGDYIRWPDGNGGFAAGGRALLREEAAVRGEHLRLLRWADGGHAVPEHRSHQAGGGGVLDTAPK